MSYFNEFFEEEEKPEVSDHSLWAERYRPSKIENFIGNDNLKKTISQWIEQQDIPQVCLFGSSGCGKTTLSKLLIKYIKCDHLFINASDENSIEDIRSKVQNFALTNGFNKLKIIVEDEADGISPEGQRMMRNLMETYSTNTRFILTANYHEKIIPAIKSRCQVFEVKPTSKIDSAKHIESILKKENIKYDRKDIVFIINSYFPDLRKIINFSQQSSLNGKLELIKRDIIDSDYKNKLIDLLKKSNEKNTFKLIRQLVADASFSNYEEVYKFLFDHVDEYSGNKSPEIILHLADAVYQSSLVFEREITFVATMHRILESLKN